MLFLLNSVYGRGLKHETPSPREHFVRPAMLFGNFEIINM